MSQSENIRHSADDKYSHKWTLLLVTMLISLKIILLTLTTPPYLKMHQKKWSQNISAVLRWLIVLLLRDSTPSIKATLNLAHLKICINIFFPKNDFWTWISGMLTQQFNGSSPSFTSTVQFQVFLRWNTVYSTNQKCLLLQHGSKVPEMLESDTPNPHPTTGTCPGCKGGKNHPGTICGPPKLLQRFLVIVPVVCIVSGLWVATFKSTLLHVEKTKQNKHLWLLIYPKIRLWGVNVLHSWSISRSFAPQSLSGMKWNKPKK